MALSTTARSALTHACNGHRQATSGRTPPCVPPSTPCWPPCAGCGGWPEQNGRTPETTTMGNLSKRAQVRSGAEQAVAHGLAKQTYPRHNGWRPQRAIAQHQRRRPGIGVGMGVKPTQTIYTHVKLPGAVNDFCLVDSRWQIDHTMQSGSDATHTRLGNEPRDRLHQRIAPFAIETSRLAQMTVEGARRQHMRKCHLLKHW